MQCTSIAYAHPYPLVCWHNSVVLVLLGGCQESVCILVADATLLQALGTTSGRCSDELPVLPALNDPFSLLLIVVKVGGCLK